MMKLQSFVSPFVASVALAFAAPALAQPSSADQKPAPASKDTYPLKTCIVSDEPLGSMGDAVVHVHKEPGKPDREVRFCCEGCIEDFKAEPAKYLKKLDAAKGKAAPAKSSAGNRNQN